MLFIFSLTFLNKLFDLVRFSAMKKCGICDIHQFSLQVPCVAPDHHSVLGWTWFFCYKKHSSITSRTLFSHVCHNVTTGALFSARLEPAQRCWVDHEYKSSEIDQAGWKHEQDVGTVYWFGWERCEFSTFWLGLFISRTLWSQDLRWRINAQEFSLRIQRKSILARTFLLSFEQSKT